MNPDLERLQPYPFERLNSLLKGVPAAEVSAISLSIGEPRHDAPQFALDAMVAALRGVEHYPSTQGSAELREAIGQWLNQRFQLSSGISAQSQILTVNGTREALFAIAQCLLDRKSNQRQVLIPNPFYQIYEGAAFLAGLEPEYYDASGSTTDFDAIPAASWAATQMLYLCNPGNPTGSTLSLQSLQKLITLAERHNFTIVSDECYSEIYREDIGPRPDCWRRQIVWETATTDTVWCSTACQNAQTCPGYVPFCGWRCSAHRTVPALPHLSWAVQCPRRRSRRVCWPGKMKLMLSKIDVLMMKSSGCAGNSAAGAATGSGLKRLLPVAATSAR